MINLYHTDCMDFMKSLPDKAYDLAIVDPPYGHGIMNIPNLSRVKQAKAKDYKLIPDIVPEKEYFDQLMRISENQIVWGANHFISMIPINSSCWIVWDKNNNTNDFADCELAWTSFDTAVRKFKFTWNGMMQENMKHKEFRIHICQKPVALYKWLLKNYASSGDKILDTHGGSMSIAIACYDMGFDLDLCELDADYYKEGKERYEAHVAKYAPASEQPVNKQGQVKLF